MTCCKKNPEIEQVVKSEHEPLQLTKIILYNDPSTTKLDLEELKDYLSSQLENVEIILRDEFFSFYLENNKPNTVAPENNNSQLGQQELISELAEKIAATKIRDIYNNNNPEKQIPPLRGEIAFEEKMLRDPTKFIPGIFYDGIRLNEHYQGLTKNTEIHRSVCHISFTPRLFGTFDAHDKRYHARAILCSYPTMISTSGIIEAPAKPKEYYRLKQELLRQNITTIDGFIPKELKEKYLRYDDPRLLEIIKGYVMQAVFYHVFSEPFCSDPNCRLFNAHWQEELLHAQLSDPEFCVYHLKSIAQLNDEIT